MQDKSAACAHKEPTFWEETTPTRRPHSHIHQAPARSQREGTKGQAQAEEAHGNRHGTWPRPTHGPTAANHSWPRGRVGHRRAPAVEGAHRTFMGELASLFGALGITPRHFQRNEFQMPVYKAGVFSMGSTPQKIHLHQVQVLFRGAALLRGCCRACCLGCRCRCCFGTLFGVFSQIAFPGLLEARTHIAFSFLRKKHWFAFDRRKRGTHQHEGPNQAHPAFPSQAVLLKERFLSAKRRS